MTSAMQRDSRGQSSVVGVILLVGIVVILSSVVGGFAFGVWDKPSNSPFISFTPTQSNATFESGCGSSPQVVEVRTLELEINGYHSSINPDNVNVTVNGYPAYDIEGYGGCQGVNDKIRNSISSISVGETSRIVTYASSEPVSNGTELSYDEDASGSRIKTQSIYAGTTEELTPGDTVRIIYTAPGSDEGIILFEYTIK